MRPAGLREANDALLSSFGRSRKAIQTLATCRRCRQPINHQAAAPPIGSTDQHPSTVVVKNKSKSRWLSNKGVATSPVDFTLSGAYGYRVRVVARVSYDNGTRWTEGAYKDVLLGDL